MIRRYLPKNLEELILWYERRVAPFSLLAGFIVDNVLFRTIDLFATTVALTLYLTCAIAGLFLLNLVSTGRVRWMPMLHIAPFFPVIVQFSFGGIFSGFFVLYSESATIAVSWVSVVILAALLIGNERFRRHYMQFSFQVGILFIAIFGFLIFLVPFALNRIGPSMFLVSGSASVALIALYVAAMWRVMPELVETNLIRIAYSTGAIFLAVNILYFTNAIPPLPLSLKEAGVYHRVVRVGDMYHVLAESAQWYREYLPFGRVFHRTPGESMYVFSSVFAPAGLGTTIYHEWQQYDEAAKKWVTVSTVEFPIVGGRGGGYRGYSLSSNSRSGAWRVNVLTAYGQVVGRTSFKVIDIPESVELEERIL